MRLCARRDPKGGGFQSRPGREGPALFVFLSLVWLSLPSAVVASDTAERTGDVLRIALPAVALSLTFVRDDAEARPQFYKSFVTMAATTWGLKAVVDKERPDGSDDDAFPSGHAAVAFQSAAFLQRRYGLKRAAWAYGLAGVVAWTRVESDQHDTADVLAGAAIGMASSFLFVDRAPGYTLLPWIDGDTVGVAVSASF